MAGSEFTIVVGSNFLKHGIDSAKVKAALHDGADELGQIEQFNVINRSPVLTGAMISDVQYEANAKGKDDPEILHVFSGTENQLDEWGRVYVQYQEGGDLGSPTYTNGPHEMYAQIATTDLPTLEDWAQRWLQGALNAITGGTP